MRTVECNVENAMGHSHKVAMVAADVARQELLRAQQEAGAAHHRRQQIGAFETAATLEMSALANTLATFEQSEIHQAQTSNTQRREIEVEADALFHQRVKTLNNENLAGHRSEIARVESFAEERHLTYRAKMHSELNSALRDSQEAQRIASDLSVRYDELLEEAAKATMEKKQLSLEAAKVWDLNRGWCEEVSQMRSALAYAEHHS